MRSKDDIHWIAIYLYAYDLHKNAEKPGVISFLSQIFCQKAIRYPRLTWRDRLKKTTQTKAAAPMDQPLKKGGTYFSCTVCNQHEANIPAFWPKSSKPN